MIKNLFLLLTVLFLTNCTTVSPNKEKENSFQEEALEKANNVNNLVLKEFALARLDLEDLNTSFNEVYLEQAFKDFDIKVEKFESFGEEGETYIYSATKNRSQVFTLDITKENVFNSLSISSPAIVDQYGVNVNTTVEQVKTLRPDLEIKKDDFSSQPILYLSNSKISYLLSMPSNVKDIYTEEDIKGLKVQTIFWKPLPTPF